MPSRSTNLARQFSSPFLYTIKFPALESLCQYPAFRNLARIEATCVIISFRELNFSIISRFLPKATSYKFILPGIYSVRRILSVFPNAFRRHKAAAGRAVSIPLALSSRARLKFLRAFVPLIKSKRTPPVNLLVVFLNTRDGFFTPHLNFFIAVMQFESDLKTFSGFSAMLSGSTANFAHFSTAIPRQPPANANLTTFSLT